MACSSHKLSLPPFLNLRVKVETFTTDIDFVSFFDTEEVEEMRTENREQILKKKLLLRNDGIRNQLLPVNGISLTSVFFSAY